VSLNPFGLFHNAVRAKDIAAVLARNGFADMLQRLELPPRILSALGGAPGHRRTQWERLRLTLEELGPTFVKFGQMLSMRPDIAPAPLIAELQKLQERVPPEPFDKIRPVVEEGLGAPLEELFERFAEAPVAAASLAQVHLAALRGSGQEVVVKVQRPGIQRVIDADFDWLLWFARKAHDRIEELRPYDLPSVVRAMRKGLEHELDFRSEARNMELFSRRAPRDSGVFCPKVYQAFCAKRVLVMERIEGLRIGDIPVGSALAKRVASDGAKSLFAQILNDGFFHADPHAGNIRVARDGRICLLDWGLVGQLTRGMRHSLADLFMAFVQGKSEQVARVAVALSDNAELHATNDMELEVMIAIRSRYDPESGEGDLGRSILELLHIFGRHGIFLSREYSLMAKAVLSIEETGKALDPDFNLRQQFEPQLRQLMQERYSPSRLFAETKDGALYSLSQLQRLPEEMHRILRKVETDSLKLNFHHRGLEELDDAISSASNKITLGIILGCLVVGSSLIVTTRIPPLLFGYPAIGLAGYLLSAILGVWVVIDILRGGRHSR